MSKDRNKITRLNALPNPFKKSDTQPSLEAISEAGKAFEKAVIDSGHRKPEVPIGIAVRVKALLEEGGWIVAADLSASRLGSGNALFHVASPELDPKPWVKYVKDLKERLEAAEAEAEGAEAAAESST